MVGSKAPRPRPTHRKKAARYHHGDLRAAAVKAATNAVATHGLEPLSLRAVAVELGVSPPALHHHFANKTELIAACAAAAFTSLDARFADVEAHHHEDPARWLEELGVAYVRFAVEQPGAFRVSFGGHVRSLDLASFPDVGPPGRSCRQRLLRAVRAAIRGDDESAVGRLFAMLWAQVLGIASLVVENELGPELGLDDVEQLVRAAVQSHLRNLQLS